MLENTEVDDSLRIQITALKADGYASRGQTLDAEMVHLNLLRDVAAKDQQVSSQDTHETLVSAGLSYAGFLTKSDRIDEAQSILLSLWSHFERGNDTDLITESSLNR